MATADRPMLRAAGADARPAAATQAFKIAACLLALVALLAWGTASHAPAWKERAAAMTTRPVPAAPQTAASHAGVPVQRPIGPGLRPSPEKLLPVDNSRFDRKKPADEPQPMSTAEPMDENMARPMLLPRPVAIDGGSFRVGRGTIRLEGIDPLLPNETCGPGSSPWPCGVKARSALRALVRSRSITCTVPGDFMEREATVDSACSLAAIDLGEWLVANGWARARDGGRYADAEAVARGARLGLWAGADRANESRRATDTGPADDQAPPTTESPAGVTSPAVPPAPPR
ncbi:hypothetical protein [Aureimonas sp. SA4125]|uniref:thermonuclease family protein n=1 Tax=Aureimonas sp. SA4125 TaxID=2826993 RepID=UPI001CC8175F|nr:hypothetical protein [Aureimonas sp. SA4125]